jgi:spore coat protein U-like protein
MNGKQRWYSRIVTAVLVAALMALAVPAQAQDVANGQALADVLAALAVIAVQDLDFQNVLQGVMKAQNENDDALSGIFSITGAASAGISVYIGLPAYMALADGSDRLSIAFGITDCSIDTTVASPSTVAAGDGWVNVDPHNLPAALVVGAGGQTNIYLGGKVIPAVNQSAGAYTGDIIVTVAYNGT